MSLETDVQGLTDATTDLLVAVNVSKATLDGKVANASSFATASLNSANASAASAATATTQATAAGTARTGAETARDAAVVAQNNAVAVVTGGTATLTPSATKIPLSDAQGKIAKGWLTNTDLVEQTDIGTGPNEIPLNQFLGELAYLDAQNIPTLGINVANAATANVTNLMQVTEISNAVPSLNLDFAKVKQLDPRITFTRASTGTYYDGKTVAKAEENLLVRSQEFDNAAWTKANVTATANSAVAPDGTTTASTFTSTNSSATDIGVYEYSASYSGTGRTVSVYAKAGTAAFLGLADNSIGGSWATFNLTTGAVASSLNCTASISSVGNGWYRCVMGNTTNSGGGFVMITANDADPAANPWQAGTCASGNTMFVWGAQLEQRAQATAYTPTTTQPVTNYIPVLQTAASGVPRFEHNPVTGESLGLEIEEQRTNLLTYSEQFDNATWAKGNGAVTSNTATSPDGTTTADNFITSAATSGTFVQQSFTSLAQAYTASFYVKPNGVQFIQLLWAGTQSTNIANFDIINGVVGTTTATSSSITSVGNGWYRVTIVSTLAAAAGAINVYCVPALTSARATNYQGNGFSGIYIWGAQLEAGAFPTSYIPTVASQVTRAADSAVMTGANFSSWYRQSEGTLYSEAAVASVASTTQQNIWSLFTDNSNNTRLWLWEGAPSTLRFSSFNSGAQQWDLITSGMSANTFFKNAGVYKTNDFAMSTNAGTVQTDTSGLIARGFTGINIGSQNGSIGFMNGTIRKITYYPQRLSNAELVEMTA